MTKPSSPSCQTFSDWGVVVPFTTPTLSHARLRPGRNGRLDVLMRNPSGGRGVYVFDLGALAVWLRKVIGIRRVGRSWRTPGGSTASGARPVQEGRPDARDPPQPAR